LVLPIWQLYKFSKQLLANKVLYFSFTLLPGRSSDAFAQIVFLPTEESLKARPVPQWFGKANWESLFIGAYISSCLCNTHNNSG